MHVVAERVDRSAGSVEHSYYLDLPGGAVWCCIHQPTGDVQGAVVICSPLYADLLANYEREANLARALVSRGIAVARFHYRGTGNSGGAPSETSWSTMVDDARAVTHHLAQRVASGRLGVVGTRIGTLVAAAAAAGLPGTPLVAWEPVIEPTRYLRDGIRAGLAREAREGATRGTTTATVLADLAERGAVDLLGFRIDAATYDSLLPRSLPGALGRGGREVLLVQFALNGRVSNGLSKVADELGAMGVRVTTATAAVAETWWFHTERHLSSASLVPDTVAWLLDRLHDAPAVSTAIETPTIVMSRSERDFEEHPLWVRAGSHEIFGMLAEPVGADAAAVSLQCWGAGGYPSFGRNGIRARLSAASARIGISDLRIDYRGVGESSGDPREIRLDRPEIDDARLALGWLDEHLAGLPRFLVGSCYGSRVALKVAPQVEELRGLVLLSPPVRDEHHMAAKVQGRAVRFGLKRALRLHVLLNLRDPIKRRSYARFVRQLGRIRREDRARRGFAPSEGASGEFLDAFARIVERQLPVLVVHAETNAFHLDFERARAGEFGRLLEQAGALVEVVVLEGAANLYATLESQSHVLAVVERWMASRLTDFTAAAAVTQRGARQPAS